MRTQLDALGETSPFDGFLDADFDAFEERKWGSRVYTMQRREARRKAVALARATHEALTSDLQSSFELGATDDAPTIANGRRVEAVSAFLTRPTPQRTQLQSRLNQTNLASREALFDIATEHQHASLLFTVRYDGFEIELLLASRAGIDRTNAARKLSYEEDRQQLVEILSGVPEARLRLGENETEASSLSPADLEGFAAQLDTSDSPMSVGHRWPRDDSALIEPGFVDSVVEAGLPLAQALRHLAWASDNDFAKVAVEEAEKKADKKLKKKKAAPSASGGATLVLNPGDRVTILSGLFAGRAGYLSESDGKGNVKVMVGPVSVTIPADDVKPAS